MGCYLKYKDLLQKYISDSGLSLSKISDKLKEKGFSTDKGYLSKLQNGKIPPAGEDLNRALAEVIGGSSEELIISAYMEKAPEELREQFENLDSITSSIDGIFQMMRKEAQQNPVFYESTRQLVADHFKMMGSEDIEENIQNVDDLFGFIDKNYGFDQKIQLIGGYFVILNSGPKRNYKKDNLPELTKKDEKDIAKKLENILESMETDTALSFDGEPMDEETKELVRAAIESNLQLTKKLAKKKFTPKKYRDEE